MGFISNRIWNPQHRHRSLTLWSSEEYYTLNSVSMSMFYSFFWNFQNPSCLKVTKPPMVKLGYIIYILLLSFQYNNVGVIIWGRELYSVFIWHDGALSDWHDTRSLMIINVTTDDTYQLNSLSGFSLTSVCQARF